MSVGRFLKFAAELRGVPSAESEKAVAEAEEKTATREVHNQAIFSLSPRLHASASASPRPSCTSRSSSSSTSRRAGSTRPDRRDAHMVRALGGSTRSSSATSCRRSARRATGSSSSSTATRRPGHEQRPRNEHGGGTTGSWWRRPPAGDRRGPRGRGAQGEPALPKGMARPCRAARRPPSTWTAIGREVIASPRPDPVRTALASIADRRGSKDLPRASRTRRRPS